ncbi:MAG TPA: CoA transferase [Acidimicrobiales bacterium]|nr:CoA transferase [Acidimicrobiales bacterium]
MASALGHIRICDFTGQLAGAGATRYLAAFGAEVIRVEDPVRQGRWDILRGSPPYVDERRGIDLGGAFNNTNPEKLGITLNLRDERGRELLRRLVAVSDVVSENFAAGVLARLGFDYDALRAIRDDIIYVSNSGFGATGPYRAFKSWGPIVQAVSGLTFQSGLAGLPPAGWGYSYMDHHGGNFMALAILAALVHRSRTGEGQWVDMSCSEAAATLTGTDILDYTVNGRPSRRPGCPDSNHSAAPLMVPHGIYPCAGDDNWVAIACRDDADWAALAALMRDDGHDVPDVPSVAQRAGAQEELDARVGAWTASRDRYALQHRLQAAGVPAVAVQRPEDRIDGDVGTSAFGLWPVAHHSAMGDVRVDGFPLHLSETDWSIQRGAPCLGEHNDYVYGELLGVPPDELEALRAQGVI